MKRNEKNSLKVIEELLERVLDELIIEIPENNMLPIPTKIFLEMEKEIGEKINLIGLS